MSGGQFIARRVASDLWPTLARVLRMGVQHTENVTLSSRMDMLYLGCDEQQHHGGNDDAPQKTEAVRRAILSSLAEIAADSQARAALGDVAAAACDAVMPFATGTGTGKVGLSESFLSRHFIHKF